MLLNSAESNAAKFGKITAPIRQDRGLKVLIEFITLIYKLNVISGNQNNMYDLSGFTSYRYEIKPISLKKMLSVLNTIHEKYKEYKQHLDSIISIYYKIKSKYDELIKYNNSLIQS